METQSYGYTAQARFGSADYTYRPLIEVEVSSESKSRIFKALVDSGTELTVMDQAIATLLGIDPRDKPSASLSGIESWKQGYIAPVSLRINGFEDIFTFNVLFIEDLGRNFDIILGQQDFFLNFDVTFKKADNMFYLERR